MLRGEFTREAEEISLQNNLLCILDWPVNNKENFYPCRLHVNLPFTILNPLPRKKGQERGPDHCTIV